MRVFIQQNERNILMYIVVTSDGYELARSYTFDDACSKRRQWITTITNSINTTKFRNEDGTYKAKPSVPTIDVVPYGDRSRTRNILTHRHDAMHVNGYIGN